MSEAAPRRSVSLLDVYKLWPLFAELEGERIRRVLEQGGLLVIQHTGGLLLFNSRRGACPLKRGVELSQPRRVGQLRSIEGRRVRAVSLVNDDRVLELDLAPLRLVLEWVREGNVLLLDGEGCILYAAHYRSMRDRAVRRGEAYRPPPKLGDFSTPPPLVVEAAAGLPRRSIVTALAQASSLPPEVVYEAALRAGVDPSSPLTPEAGLRVLEAARGVYLEAIRLGRRGFSVKVGGAPVVYPFKPSLTSEAVEVDFLEAFPEYMAGLMLGGSALAAGGADPRTRMAEALGRLEAAARALLGAAPRVQELIDRYRSLRSSGTSWRSIEEELRRLYPEVRGFRHEDWVVVVELGGVEVDVDARRSAYADAEELFEKAKSLRRRLSEAKPQAEQPVKVVAAAGRGSGGPWYKDFRYFTTSGGFLVVAGRSAGQNELLVRRYMEGHDIFLHADIHGAPAVILKTGGREASEQDVAEAAQFAACYSGGWKAGLLALDVYWVEAHQVSKAAPSGEYLGKGAFMVYGKRNWARGVPLELLVGYAEGEGLVALPALRMPSGGCFMKLTPGPLPRELAARKVAEFLRRECGVRVHVDDVLRRLPEGTFHVERWVSVGSRLH